MDFKVIDAGQTNCVASKTCCTAWCAARSDCVAATEEDQSDGSVLCRRYRACELATESGARTYTKCDGAAARYSSSNPRNLRDKSSVEGGRKVRMAPFGSKPV